MATHIAIGFSSAEDPVTAFKDAAIMAKARTGLPKHDLAFIITTPSYAAATNPSTATALESLHKILNPKHLIGLAAPALILTDSIQNKGVMVLAMASDDITFGIASQNSISLMPLQETALRFTRELTAHMNAQERHGAILFCDSVELNHSLIIRGLQEGLGKAFNIAGAINPGGIFFQNQVLTDALAAILIGGQAAFLASARHGWQPLGKPRIVTASDGNLIRSIDNKPAISIYQEYFPEECARLIPGQLGDIGLLYPLGFNTARPREYLIKNPIAVLPNGSLVCQGDVHVGTQTHLMIGDKDACRQAAHDAAIEVLDKLHGKHPKMIFIFASIARKKLFGRSAWQEINRIKELLGLACPVFGMYTYGELGSGTSMDLQIHNASILIAAIG